MPAKPAEDSGLQELPLSLVSTNAPPGRTGIMPCAFVYPRKTQPCARLRETTKQALDALRHGPPPRSVKQEEIVEIIQPKWHF